MPSKLGEPTALTVGATYFVTALAVLLMARGANGVAIVWVANAFLLAFLTLSSRDRYPSLVLIGGCASIAANMVAGNSLVASIGFSVANLADALIAVMLLKRTGGVLPDYASLVGLLRATAITCLIAPAISASIAVPVAV